MNAMKPLMVVLLMMVVFIADSYTQLGFAHGYLYVPLVLYACTLNKPKFAHAVLIVSILLVTFGFFISPNTSPNLSPLYVYGNRFISVVILIATYLLMLSMQQAQRTVAKRKDLIREQNYFKELTNALPIYIWTAAPDGQLTYSSMQVSSYVGKPMEEILPVWLELLHPEDRERTAAIWQRSVATGNDYEVEFRIIDKHDHYNWMLARAKPHRDEDGAIQSWFGSLVDITELRQLAEESQRLARSLQVTLESIADPFFTLTSNFQFNYLNEHTEVLLGISRHKLLNAELSVRDNYGFNDTFIDNLHAAFEKQQPAVFITPFKQDRIMLEVHTYPAPQGVAVYLRDITRERQMEQQLRQIQRMESVGHLTGGIAHDFNNLLTVILGNADGLIEKLTPSSQHYDAIKTVIKAAERGADLTSSLLSFSRRQTLQPEPVAIDELLSSLTPLLKSSLGGKSELHIDYQTEPSELPKISVDPAQLESSLINLAVNSKLAMPKGGLFNIQLRTTELDEHYCQLHSDVTPGHYLSMTVADTGEGIAKSDLPYIFEPFYSRRESGQGTGLGLSMVFGFVKQSGGHISVYSELNRGTTFNMYFPIAQRGSLPTQNELPHTHKRTQRLQVMLVEDDQQIRQLALSYLQLEGFDVVAFGTGDEALAYLQQNPPKDVSFSLLITDIVMPGNASGIEVAERFVQVVGHRHVLYTSGFSDRVAFKDVPTALLFPLLAKPYRRSDLISHIETILQEQPQS